MSAFGKVDYTGLEPLSNSGTGSDIIFNLPAGPNNMTLGDDTLSGNSMSRLSGATIETTDFANPTNSLTINRCNAADSMTVNVLPGLQPDADARRCDQHLWTDHVCRYGDTGERLQSGGVFIEFDQLLGNDQRHCHQWFLARLA